MLIPAHIFREYDIRGAADKDLSSELVSALGEVFARMISESRATDAPPLRIAIARDCRESSPRIHDAVILGLRRGGAHVLDLGTGPTPLLYFAVHHLCADGGVMVTGSHNPPGENGLNLMRGTDSFSGDTIRRVRDRVAVMMDEPAPPTGGIEQVSVEQAYLSRVTQGISLAESGLKVVVDGGNGSAGPLGVNAMRAAGLDPDALYCEMDGRFPHHLPDPTTPATLTDLVGRVRETGAHVGIAWDGDGDRIGAVDATGEIIWGDKLMALFARDILTRHPGAKVVCEVMCSQSLCDDVAAHGGKPILWQTGYSKVWAKMQEEGALLAGEMSGHLFFGDAYLGYDDAIYAALRLLDVLARNKKTIGQNLSDLPRTFASPEVRIPCPERLKGDLVLLVGDHYRKDHEVIDVDGARILFGDGAWGLVRASNTGSLLVLRFEARTEERVAELRAEVEGVLTEARRALGG
jgi:phosphomannomutase / phosphoglucomutase